MSFLETIRQVITPGASQMARRGRAGVEGQRTLMKSRSNGKWQNSNGLRLLNWKITNEKPFAFCHLPFAI
jgi:hypothetical protein